MTTYKDTDRMRVRGIVRVAAEVLPAYWPMRSFVHHNPLHGLEGLPFEEAVREGERLFGGRGYMAPAAYREALAEGRIAPAHLDAALAARGDDASLWLGERAVSRRAVQMACLTHGLDEADAAPLAADATLARRLAERLPGQGAAEAAAPPDAEALARTTTLAAWCDRALGTEIVARMDDELVRWCGAYMDEGQAAWPMPGRELGLYRAWRALAGREWRAAGIAGSRALIRALPETADDALLESLARLGVPEAAREANLSLELAALPGWAGYIKWRSEHPSHPWQQAHPASLVKYLAIRLFYERELVEAACRRHLGVAGTFEAVALALRERPEAFAPAEAAPAIAPAERAGRRLAALAQALALPGAALEAAAPEALGTLLGWLDDFGPDARGAVWLHAYEAGYQTDLLERLAARAATLAQTPEVPVRPQSQSIYCLDVRPEPFRRHLEAIGDHETLAFGGFFGVAMRFRPWGREGTTDQVPAVLSPRNEVREVPRSYHEHLVPKHRSRARLLKTGHALLRDMKENVVTPYVMVESLGWFYGLPLVGKTLAPRAYHRLANWVGGLLLPTIPTDLTVDKLSPDEVREMVAAEQRDVVWKALRARFGARGVTPEGPRVEALRQVALGDVPASELERVAQALEVAPAELEAVVAELRSTHGLAVRPTLRRKERLTRMGMTLDEQVATVETFLRAMGLTGNFARVVLVCGHGSTSDNNPYESALDCGACGGNPGSPNARAMARMANSPRVRERLAAAGIALPADTVFLAGQLDTTTLEVRLEDLEDVPSPHRLDVARLQEDLAAAGRLARAEALSRLPDVSAPARRPDAEARERSVDWSQSRPEWGLSGNAAFIIGPRAMTKGLDLGGRVFLHSYDPAQDPKGRLLDGILTAPQLVAQWISMEHYFSTTGADVYGSGSKVYHNVTGRVGVMAGPASDLRIGLARQSVMSGARPYHEPMRLLTVVAARRAVLDGIIARHELLQNYYHHAWVHLVAWDPDDGRFYRYDPTGAWRPVSDALHASLGKDSMV